MDITIEKVDIKEFAPILFDVCSKTFIESYHTTIENLETFLKDYENCSAFIAYEKSSPIGLIIYSDRKNFIELEEFGVIPEYQSEGIGKLLMQKFLENTNKEIRLMTNPHNSSAIIFYLKH